MQTAHTHRYRVQRSCAAHCTTGGSNKYWVGVLVHVLTEEQDLADTEAADAQTWMFLSAYGKAGSSLQGGKPGSLLSRREAEHQFETKVKEKLSKHHYTEVDFPPFLAAFELPLELPEQSTTSTNATDGTQRSPENRSGNGQKPARVQTRASLSASGYGANRAEAVGAWQPYVRPEYGMTEKANGERCLLSYDGEQHLHGYNRNGEPTQTYPGNADALRALGVPFLLDGERLVGAQEGEYVVFDVLQWKGDDVRSLPYQERITVLQRAFVQVGLVKNRILTPTLRSARANSPIPGLLLLTPVTRTTNVECVVRVVGQRGGEGVILRQLSAPYTQPKAVLKYKFTADLDAVVIGCKPGSAGGSLLLGLRRPADNAVIACGYVRSGLTQQDVAFFTARLAQRIWSVLKVTYLPSRTSGLALVESSTHRTWLRSDKDAWDCTTDQLGAEKATLVAHAPACVGIHFPLPHES